MRAILPRAGRAARAAPAAVGDSCTAWIDLCGSPSPSSSAGTACPAARRRAALDSVRRPRRPATDVDLVGVAARHGAPAARRRGARRSPSRHLPLPRLALYESWHRLRRPAVERATGPVDVVHATGVAVPPPSAPLVVTVHDLAFLPRPRAVHPPRASRFFRRAIELARRDADLVLCPSQATARRLRGRTASTRPGCASCRGASTPRRSTRRRGRRGAGPATASTGRYVLLDRAPSSPARTCRALLDAFARLDRPDVDAGARRPRRLERGPRRAGSRALGDRVRPLGFVAAADLRGALRRAPTVFCYPSLREGFGLPGARGHGPGHAGGHLGGHGHRGGRRRRRRCSSTRSTSTPSPTRSPRLLDDPARGARLGAAGRARAAERSPGPRTAGGARAPRYGEAAA